ncbi:MAG: SIR2 family protein [Labilithrix sp.]|nr:SIR2 family protein [Labilithrix sp.]
MSSPVTDKLAELMGKCSSAPFLFVGSGFSRRYADLETWNEMLAKFANPYLPRPYEYYRSKVGGDYPRAAGEVANAFHEIWWTHADFDESRKELAGQSHPGPSYPLKYEISKYLKTVKFKTGMSTDGVDRDHELEVLKRATIDGIITTNWDTIVESIFPDYSVFVGQNALLVSQPHYVAEVHKIHGSAEAPSSLVLTDEDYANFNEKNPYLAAKLLAVFIEHPVIFFGYSISDKNIASTIRLIAKALTPSSLGLLEERLIFVQREKGASKVESSFIDVDGERVPLSVLRAKDFCEVYDPLTTLTRRFPARLLRQIKDRVYDLVLTNDPKQKLLALDIENADKFDNIEVVYGVGVAERLGEKGYIPVSALDLFQDVMKASPELVPMRVLEQTLPKMQHRKYLPVFWYLRSAGMLNDDGMLKDSSKLDPKVVQMAARKHANYHPPDYYKKRQAEIVALGSVKNVVAKWGADEASLYIALLRSDQIDLEELRPYLVANMRLLSSQKLHKTYFGALIGLYDFLMFATKPLAKGASSKATTAKVGGPPPGKLTGVPARKSSATKLLEELKAKARARAKKGE